MKEEVDGIVDIGTGEIHHCLVYRHRGMRF